MVIQTAEIQISDFSGGLVGDAKKAAGNQCLNLTNMLITPHGSAAIRYGSAPILDSGYTVRVAGIYENNNEIYLTYNGDIYKIENDQSPPELGLVVGWVTSTIVNPIQYSVGDVVRYGDYFYLCLSTHTPNDFPTDLAANKWREMYQKVKVPTPATPTVTQMYSSLGSNNVCGRKWRNHILLTGADGRRPHQLFTDDGGVRRNITCGLPYFTSAQKSEITISGSSGTGSKYLFGFVWSYTYKVGGVSYRKVSDVYTVQKEFANGVGIDFTLPTMDNSQYGAVDAHWDTANVKLEIYASASGQQELFLLDTKSNGTVSAPSYTIDNNTIVTKQALYTNGGLLEHNMPPICKDIQLINDTAYYLNITEELQDSFTVTKWTATTVYLKDQYVSYLSYTYKAVDNHTSTSSFASDSAHWQLVVPTVKEHKPYRVIQSIPSIPTSVNYDFFLDVDDEIVGGGVARGSLIVFTRTYIYRVDGQISANGSGSLRANVMSTSIGCLSRDSIVTTSDGVYFAGNDGLWFTDGVSFKELTGRDKSLEKKYRSLINTEANASRIYGTHEATNNNITWSMSSVDGASENDMWLVYDIDKDSFSISNGETFYSSCTLYYKEDIYRGDDKGYIYRHNRNIFCDYARKDGLTIEWEKNPIKWELRPAFFTSLNDRLWARSINVAVEAGRDLVVGLEAELISGRTHPMVPIAYKSNNTWRDINSVWGDSFNLWKPSTVQTKRRRLPKGAARSRGLTVGLKAGEGILFVSDVLGEADVTYAVQNDPTQLAIELVGATAKWPKDCVGYKISLEKTNVADWLPNVVYGRADWVVYEGVKYVSEINNNTSATFVEASWYKFNYDVKHLITARSDTTLTVMGGAVIPSSNMKWQISGIPKEQDVEIKSITYVYGKIGNEDNQFQTGQDGGNA